MAHALSFCQRDRELGTLGEHSKRGELPSTRTVTPRPVPSMVPAWRGVNGMTEPLRPPSPHQAGLPVDGIVHDEHFVLIPGPFFFLQRKKLKMSTSDAALEIKDRAETVQGQTWEALVTALLLLPCNPSPRAGSCWGPAMSHITSHGTLRAPSIPTSGLAQPPCRNMASSGTQLIPAHPSLSQPTRVPQKLKDAAGPRATRGGLLLLRHRCPRDQGCLPSSSSSE